jgi:hypothetical protein
MKRIVWTFGLISGAVMAVFMDATVPFIDDHGASAGVLIAAIASLCYVATWEVIYYKFMPDFYTKYGQSVVDQARRS